MMAKKNLLEEYKKLLISGPINKKLSRFIEDNKKQRSLYLPDFIRTLESQEYPLMMEKAAYAENLLSDPQKKNSVMDYQEILSDLTILYCGNVPSWMINDPNLFLQDNIDNYSNFRSIYSLTEAMTTLDFHRFPIGMHNIYISIPKTDLTDRLIPSEYEIFGPSNLKTA